MGNSGSANLRPLILVAIVGLILGLIAGLTYAWVINPATYAGGAFPHELSEGYQKLYTMSVAEAYMTTLSSEAASQRLREFSVAKKVSLLAGVDKDYRANNLLNEANLVARLATELKVSESWPDNEVSSALTQAAASNEFANALGQAAPPVDGSGSGVVQPTAAPDQPVEPVEEGTSIFRYLLYFLVIILVIAIVAFLLTRIKTDRKAGYGSGAVPEDIVLDDGSQLQPLRQWVGTYTVGQDNYDESFTVETSDGDFLGECGMGILEGFASGTPKKVLAFDVWLFDKTDIRTVSMPVMSKFSFEDEVLRGKLPPDSNPVLAVDGGSFDIETTALMVKVQIDEVAYGDGPPDMSYFTTLKISLSAYLKPGVDVSGSMPIPEGY